MELRGVVERYAEAIQYVDKSSTHVSANARTGVVYQPGAKSMSESTLVRELDEAWEYLHPGERQLHRLDVPYPGLPSTAKADHVITTDGDLRRDEWAIEVKRLQLVGDNGKRNDYATTKVLSPYLKDRGMLHDAARLREYGFTRKVAIIGYCFEYDTSSIALARAKHTSPDAMAVIDAIEATVRSSGPLRIRPLVEFADAILGLRGFTKGPRAEAGLEAWRHPAGGKGLVFGWEIRRPQLEPDFDPRHPW